MKQKYKRFTKKFMQYLETLNEYDFELYCHKWTRDEMSIEIKQRKQIKKEWHEEIMLNRSISFAQGYWKHNLTMKNGIVMKK